MKKPFDEAAWLRAVAAQRASDLYAPHRNRRGRFFNPWMPHNRPTSKVLYPFLSRRARDAWEHPAPATPVMVNDGAYLADPLEPPSLTWIGHATFALQWSGQVVLTDPLFSQSRGVARREVPPAFGPAKIPDGAVALISHNHYDHLDAESLTALGQRISFLCPLGLKKQLRQMGARQVWELDWWQSLELDGTRFTCLPAQHWSRRLGQGYNRSLWCAWLMERGGLKVFFVGDTGYFVGFKEFGRRWPGLDLALLPAGSTQPRGIMHYVHLDVGEMLRAFEDLGARILVPGQWGTLKLGDEPVAWPLEELQNHLRNRPALRPCLEIMPVGGRLFLN